MTAELQTAGRIVVGTDGSLRADKAVAWAANRAAARNLPLLILLVVPELPLPGRTAAAAAINQGTNYVDDFLAESQQKVEAVAERLRAEYPGVEIEARVVQGHASSILAEASKDAALVVVGARGQNAPLSVKLLGGVSDAVASHAHGPVAVISDFAEENPNGPVVVGVDDSAPARAAARIAFDAAQVRGVPVIAVNAWDFGPYDAFNAEIWDHSMQQINTSLTDLVNEVLAPLREEFPNVEVEVRIVRGRPENAIVDASKGAGLVVVGSRGRGGFKGLMLGSTSKHVLRESHAPVIVTRG